MKPVEITAENFEDEVLQSNLPILLDFWAAWCGPCRFVAPALDSIAEEYADRLRVGKVNVDEQPGLAGAFGVSGIPMLALVRDREVVAIKVGAGSKEALVAAFGLADLPAVAAA